MPKMRSFLQSVLLIGFNLVGTSLWGQTGRFAYVANSGKDALNDQQLAAERAEVRPTKHVTRR